MSSWEKTKQHGKAGFDKLWALADKLGQPVNKLTNKIGSEAFWPTTLDKESAKAARILKSFCKDGFYTEALSSGRGTPQPPTDGPKGKPKVLVKIPQSVIQNAVGLAIFTTMRTGLWVSGSGGSGVLLSRLPNGEWSPPSGILIHTLGVGWMAGIDIYDCVVVINHIKALEAFKRLRVSLGGEVSVVAGPVGVGGIVDNNIDLRKGSKPIFTYMKSRGLYAGLQLDGTFIIERTDENARFYNQPKIGVTDILSGNVLSVPPETRVLLEVVKAAEGRPDVDEKIVHEVMDDPAPADLDIEKTDYVPTEEQKSKYGPQNSEQYAGPAAPPYAANDMTAYYPPPPSEQSHLNTGGANQGIYYPPPPSGSPPRYA